MAMSTFQKVTLATCLVLCVALLLPKMLLSRGRKDAERPEGSGHLPPMMHRQLAPDGRGQRVAGTGFSRAHNPEAIARAKGAGPGAGGKSNLAGQIIPVYGFGILLYILYILFKITSKGSSRPSESRCPSVRSENKKRKITDFELAQLQEKLRETELVMENIVSNVHHSPDRVKGVMADQEENLLQQLTEITRVMKEGKLLEDVTPQKKKQEDWAEASCYPEEPQQYWDPPHCCCQHHGPPTEDEDQRPPADGADATAGGEHGPAAEEGSTEPAGEIGQSEEVQEIGRQVDLGVAQEDLAGVLQELELSLKMTAMMEQDKMEDLGKMAETAAPAGTLRRRSRRKRAKKASQ